MSVDVWLPMQGCSGRSSVCYNWIIKRTQIHSYLLAPLKLSKVEVLCKQVWELPFQRSVQITCMIHNQKAGRVVKKS